MLNLNQWSRELTGLPGNDVWLCYQFDNAVGHLGSWVEMMLHKTDKKGRPIHKIEDLLKPKSDKPASTYDRLLAFFGMPKDW